MAPDRTAHDPLPEQLHDQAARTRAELGDTVEALAASTDVPARATKEHTR